MRMTSIAGAAVLAVLAAAPAAAQEAADRYTLERSSEGFVRMDRRTGELSVCEERSGQLVCKLAMDERSAFEEEVERLRAALHSLEERVAALEAEPRAAPEPDLPDEQTFDQALDLMERFFRRFMGMVQEFERETEEPQPDAGTPQRT